jgi:hypothetical protein
MKTNKLCLSLRRHVKFSNMYCVDMKTNKLFMSLRRHVHFFKCIVLKTNTFLEMHEQFLQMYCAESKQINTYIQTVSHNRLHQIVFKEPRMNYRCNGRLYCGWACEVWAVVTWHRHIARIVK